MPNGFDIGIEQVNSLLLPESLEATGVLTLEGPPATCKTVIARNFLFRGMYLNQPCLLVRLSEDDLLRQGRMSPLSREMTERLRDFALVKESAVSAQQSGAVPLYRSTTYRLENRNQTVTRSALIREVSFHGHNMFPEEVLDIVGATLEELRRPYATLPTKEERRPLVRVVFDNVGLLGVGYPLLRSSKSMDDLFLTEFVHLMRMSKVSLILLGTSVKEASAAWVERARTLSDATMSTRMCDVFGERRVIITGGGLVAGDERPLSSQYETVPGVIRFRHDDGHKNIGNPHTWFDVDFQYLRGLVGLGSLDVGQPIHLRRPGLEVYLFQEGDNHSRYRKQLEKMLRAAYARSLQVRHDDSGVHVAAFDRNQTDSYHASLQVLQGAPIDKTVVLTVDDYWDSDSSEYADAPGQGFEQQLVNVYDRFCDVPQWIVAAATEINPVGAVKREWEWQKRLLDSDPGRRRSVEKLVVQAVKLLRNRANRRPELLRRELRRFSFNSLRMQYIASIGYYRHSIIGERCREDALRAIPFTSNVLLIAGHAQFRGSWYDLARQVETKKQSLGIIYTDEKLACILMDALTSWYPRLSRAPVDSPEGQYRLDFMRGKMKRSMLLEPILDRITLLEVLAMAWLLGQSFQPDKEASRKASPLGDDAHVYIAWYSELREMLSRSAKRIELAKRLTVSALPGGGFRGDWFLGIVYGSVSADFGLEVINTICQPTAEVDRFNHGVGLPTLRLFYRDKSFKLWPGSQVPLRNLWDIYREATSRAFISDYRSFRLIVQQGCWELVRIGYAYRENTLSQFVRNCKKSVRTILEEMAARIAAVIPKCDVKCR